MASTSSIEWTDATVNFWWGCTKVGPGCDHCYAETLNKVYGNRQWGHAAPRRLIKGAAAALRRLNRAAPKFAAQHGRRRRVFMQSMSDLFDNEVDQEWRSDALIEAENATGLDIQFLTKRISNVVKMIPPHWLAGGWPQHIGLMITVVNQAEADRDLPRLLHLKARCGIPWVGLSIEPMLGLIDLTHIDNDGQIWDALRGTVLETVTGSRYARRSPTPAQRQVRSPALAPRLDWVIVGGESGRDARPLPFDALRQLRTQCEAAGTPFFFKQWGEFRLTSDANGPYMAKWGKKAAGRELDGRTHDQFWRVAA